MDNQCFIDWLPLEILTKIFQFVKLNNIPLKVSHSWYNLFTNINFLIILFPAKPYSSAGISHSIELLKRTTVPPTIETVEKLVWNYPLQMDLSDYKNINCYDDLFAETYDTKIWENMRLPTWQEITNDIYINEDRDKDGFYYSEFVVKCLGRGKAAINHVMDLFAINRPSAFLKYKLTPTFCNSTCFEKLKIDSESMHFYLQQKWFPTCPTVLASFAKLGLPFKYLKEFAEVPMYYDLTPDSRMHKVIFRETPFPREYVYEKICKSLLHGFYYDNRHANANTIVKITNFEYFYRLCNTDTIKNIFVLVLSSIPYTKKLKKEILKTEMNSIIIHIVSFQNLLYNNRDVHPINTIYANSTYKGLIRYDNGKNLKKLNFGSNYNKK